MDQPPSRWKRKLAELEKEFESRELELKVLRDLDQRLLAEDGSLTDTCAFIARALSNLTELNQAEVLMRQRNVLEVVAAYPETTWSSPLGLRDSVCGWCALNAETVQIDDVLNNDKFSQLYKNFRDDQTIPMRSELAAPIKFGNVAVGVLNIENSRSRAFDTHDRDVLETLFGTCLSASI